MHRATASGATEIVMNTKPKAKAQPPIQIRETDAERVTNLAIGVEGRLPKVAELLLGEINRAKVVPDFQLSAEVIAMQSTAKFVDEASGVERSLQLVYPQDADIEAGRISILSLVGAGLLGLKPGQSIVWPDRAGNERTLRIIEVIQD